MTLTELAEKMRLTPRKLAYYRDQGLFRSGKKAGRGSRPKYDGYDISRVITIELMIDSKFDIKTIKKYVKKYGKDELELQNACIVASHIMKKLLQAELPGFDGS